MPITSFDLGRDAKLHDLEQSLIEFWGTIENRSAGLRQTMAETDAAAATLREMVSSGGIARAEPQQIEAIMSGIAEMLSAHVTAITELLGDVDLFPVAVKELEETLRARIRALQQDAKARRQ
jgi:ABC-type transporter Mla subunit MlaD